MLFLNNIKTYLSLCLINIEHPSFVYQSSSTFKIGSPWNILKATCVLLLCTQIFRKVSQLGKLKCQVGYYVVYHKKARILWATESMNKCEDLIVNGCELQCIPVVTLATFSFKFWNNLFFYNLWKNVYSLNFMTQNEKMHN